MMTVMTKKEDYLKNSLIDVKNINPGKQSNSLIKEARQLLDKIQHEESSSSREKFGSGKTKKKTLKGGRIGPENTSLPNRPPKKKKDENPQKKELSNPQGLDFANQAGALMAQLSKIEMLPPKDMMRESTKPERTMSGVKSESTKVLQCKANVFDITMQGRRRELHL